MKLKRALAFALAVSLVLNGLLLTLIIQEIGVKRMLLCEQERIVGSELNLLNDWNVYSTTSTAFGTLHDYGNITVPAGGALVYFNVGTEITSSGLGSNFADFAIQLASAGLIIGKHMIWSPGVPSPSYDVMGCIIALPAGTYDVKVLARVDPSGLSTAYVTNMTAGITSFNDVYVNNYTSVTGGTLTINNVQVNNRNTPIGPLKLAVCVINVGVSLYTLGCITVQVDGVTQTPDVDAGIGNTVYDVLQYFVPLSVGVSHTVTVTVNSSVTAYVSVVMCPWILTTSARGGHQPVSLCFSQNSILYTNIGSLFYNSVKNAYIGSQKGVSFGPSDYYAQGTAEVGILSFNYTFTSLNVSAANFVCDGLGACIENIGVDIA